MIMNKQYIDHSDIIKGPFQLSIDITNNCNYRCLHCYNFSGENNCVQNELTDEEFMSLIDDVAKMKPLSVCLCGGEPLLRKELLFKSINKLASAGIDVAFVSNGFYLTKDIVKKIKKAGLSRIQLSLDGLKGSHDKLRGFDGAYEKVLIALKNLKDENINTGIAFTPTKWNIEDFEEIVKICDKYKVNELRLQRTMPIGRGSENDIVPDEVQYRKLKKKFHRLKSEYTKLRFEWGDAVDHLIRFPKYNKMCCPFISIKANGNIVPSMYLPVSVGNVKRHSLLEYWDQGLGRVWSNQFLQNVASNILCMNELNLIQTNLPRNFKEEDLDMDIL